MSLALTCLTSSSSSCLSYAPSNQPALPNPLYRIHSSTKRHSQSFISRLLPNIQQALRPSTNISPKAIRRHTSISTPRISGTSPSSTRIGLYTASPPCRRIPPRSHQRPRSNASRPHRRTPRPTLQIQLTRKNPKSILPYSANLLQPRRPLPSSALLHFYLTLSSCPRRLHHHLAPHPQSSPPAPAPARSPLNTSKQHSTSSATNDRPSFPPRGAPPHPSPTASTLGRQTVSTPGKQSAPTQPHTSNAPASNSSKISFAKDWTGPLIPSLPQPRIAHPHRRPRRLPLHPRTSHCRLRRCGSTVK